MRSETPFVARGGLNNPSVLLPRQAFGQQATSPYTGEAHRIGLPKKILRSKRFFGKRRRRRKKRSGCRKAIARICALRRRGDSLSLASLDSSPKPTPKKYYVFFWGPRGRSQGKFTPSVTTPKKTSDVVTASRAVEPFYSLSLVADVSSDDKTALRRGAQNEEFHQINKVLSRSRRGA